MKLPFKVAVRFLKSSKGQTLLISLGIGIGVSVQIFIGSLIQGLQTDLINKTIGNSSQITITSKTDDKTIDDYENKVNKILNTDSRIENLSISADGAALIEKNDETYSVLIRGMNILDGDKIYNILENIYEGNAPEKEDEIIIGKELQESLNANIGDKINIITNAGTNKDMTISGFYDFNVASLNKSWIISTLKTSQDLFSLEDKVTSIEMQVTDVFKADEISSLISNTLDSDYTITNWKAENGELLSGLNGQSISSIMIQIFVLVSVVLGIASVLAISVVQKSKQIGILKAMGIKDRSSSLIFLFQGLILGIIGSILGILFGIGLLAAFSKFALNPDGTPVINMVIDYKFIILSAFIAILSATIASLIPARASSKLSPIEVIKNA